MTDYKIYSPSNVLTDKIGKGTKIGAYADIAENVVIGEGCNIQCHVSVPRNWVIGDGVFIGPQVTFVNDRFIVGKCDCGSVGNFTRIGANSTILPVKIGCNCFIGSGCKVNRDMEDGEVWI